MASQGPSMPAICASGRTIPSLSGPDFRRPRKPSQSPELQLCACRALGTDKGQSRSLSDLTQAESEGRRPLCHLLGKGSPCSAEAHVPQTLTGDMPLIAELSIKVVLNRLVVCLEILCNLTTQESRCCHLDASTVKCTITTSTEKSPVTSLTSLSPSGPFHLGPPAGNKCIL
jgi:hypothetical protein